MKKVSRKIIIPGISLFLATMLTLLVFLRLNDSPDIYRERTAFLLGTYIHIKIYGFPDNDFLDELVQTINEWENLISVNRAETELSEVNRLSGEAPVKISPFTYELLEEALKYARKTEGYFNPAIGPLVKLWQIGTPDARIPAAEEIEEALLYTDFTQLEVSKTSAFLTHKGAAIDTGAIAKGFISDKLASMIREKGYEKAIINLGGNALVLGNRPGGGPYSISVQDPWSDRGAGAGIIRTTDMSLVSSGTYERFFEQDGIRYHHILDPETGFPVRNGLAGVTIACSSSTQADALSTATFVMGLEKGMTFIENLSDTEALFITENKEIYLTSGMKEIFVLTSDEFEIMN